jgi:hypothetical protein
VSVDAERLRNLVEQVVDRSDADAVEHRADVVGRMRMYGIQPPAAATAS